MQKNFNGRGSGDCPADYASWHLSQIMGEGSGIINPAGPIPGFLWERYQYQDSWISLL